MIYLALLILILTATGLRALGEELSTTGSDSVSLQSGTFSEDEQITVSYYDTAIKMTYYFTTPYSDSFFDRDSSVFYMDLAQASFGLTISAFRSVEDESTPRDQNSCSYFSAIGFENSESFWYDQDPTQDSIANVIAEKKIGDETVIAIACNGVDYGYEWLSNMTLGTGTDHEGFSSAASICEERLSDYMERHEITGNVKLWISGHSRAAAVGNLLAGRLIDSGLFSDVYGYFFATPNNTREPTAYANLFNMIGQYDAVPWIPFSCWGYGHNGIDLYLPAQESNSSYSTSFAAANEIYKQVRGEDFHNNPDLNRQLYVIEELVTVIFPSYEDYVSILQPQLLSLFDEDSDRDLLSLLKEALNNIENFSDERQQAVDSLIEYLDTVIYEYISGNYSQVSDGSWRLTSPLSQNVFFEHMAHVYGSWLFSTEEPANLFVDNTETMHLVIKGDVNLEVWDEYGIVQSITSGNEEEIYAPGSENRSSEADCVSLYALNHDGSVVISVPSDRDYTLKLYINENQGISLFSDVYSYQSQTDPSDIFFFLAQEGQCIVLSDLFSDDGMKFRTDEGTDIRVLRQTMPPGITSLVAREKLARGSFTVQQVLYAIAFFLLMPILLLITALLIFAFGHKRRKRKAHAAVTVCFGILVLVLGAGAVVFRLLLPNIMLVSIAYASLAAVFAFISILRIIRKRRSRAAV